MSQLFSSIHFLLSSFLFFCYCNSQLPKHLSYSSLYCTPIISSSILHCYYKMTNQISMLQQSVAKICKPAPTTAAVVKSDTPTFKTFFFQNFSDISASIAVSNATQASSLNPISSITASPAAEIQNTGDHVVGTTMQKSISGEPNSTFSSDPAPENKAPIPQTACEIQSSQATNTTTTIAACGTKPIPTTGKTGKPSLYQKVFKKSCRQIATRTALTSPNSCFKISKACRRVLEVRVESYKMKKDTVPSQRKRVWGFPSV